MPSDTLRLFNFIPSQVIHDMGVLAGFTIILITISGLVNMARRMSEINKVPPGTRLNWLEALWQTIGVEVLGQRSYRRDCEAYSQEQPWFKQQWLIHASILWGFIGLFLATALDYLLELLGVKPTGTWVPIWYPVRLLGTFAGILLMYGVSATILRRWRKADETSQHSTPSDWVFLILLWLGGSTGFALEVSLYLPEPHAWSYWMLLIHLVVIGEFLILIPFSKFAHAMYRTVALYIHSLKPLSDKETVIAENQE